MASKSAKCGGHKMTLYHCPFHRSFKCLWLIHELGIEDHVQLVMINTFNKDTEEYKEYVKSVHSHGTVPALVVEAEGEKDVMLESTAICLYLADLEGKLAPALNKRRVFYDWCLYGSITVEEIMTFFYWQWVMPSGEPDPAELEKMQEKFDTCMKRLASVLERGPYVCGDSLTVADVLVGFNVWGSTLEMFNNGALSKDKPEIQAYVKRLTERPAFQAAIGAQGDWQH